MTNINEFKEFVKKNPILITHVNNNDMTWQKFYEMYDLYGEDNEVWKSYLTIEKELKEKTTNNSVPSFNELVKMAKNLDIDKVQTGVSSLQKAVGLFGELFTSKSSNTPINNYKPRPLYRSFDD